MKLRESNLEKLKTTTFDALVIGGGINGAVSSASLAGRGAKVALIDRLDFAGFTSQQSSNLAWGGIKYMESFDFPLVRKLCLSRNHLLRSYPTKVREIRFYAVHPKGFRHSLMKLFAGTWTYWFFGNCFTKPPRLLSKETIAKEEPIINLEDTNGGFEYSDAYFRDNDARFVFSIIRTALNYGCIAANYVESLGAERKDGLWLVKCRNLINGEEFEVRTKSLINTCGPYVDQHNQKTGQQTEHRHVFSKGIHLIVDKLTPNQRVLTFISDDGRMFFVVPMGPKTCIGTTDTRVDKPETEVTDEDRQFVLNNINTRLKLEKPLTEADIIAERCGVRPLVVSGEQQNQGEWMLLSRKHAIDVNYQDAHISIFGGKLTDCINVGEEVCDIIKNIGINLKYPKRVWYGEPPNQVRDEFFHQATLLGLDDMTSSHASEPLSKRLWRRYGELALHMLEKIRADPAMAELLIEGTEYIRVELEIAARHEMVTKLSDFLRRRSKIEQVVRKEDIRHAPGLMEACHILFGEEALHKFKEYFGE